MSNQINNFVPISAVSDSNDFLQTEMSEMAMQFSSVLPSLYRNTLFAYILYTLTTCAELYIFRIKKTPSYILLYIAPCKIHSIYYFPLCYNSNVKFYPIWSVLLISHELLFDLSK